MTVKTRETLMQRAMTGKPIMGQELRDLIDTMFWLKASPEQRIAQVVQQVAGRSTPSEAIFPDVPGTGFIKIGADRKWFTDPTIYLTQPQGDSFYFRNALFPMDPSLYLAGDRTFKNFTDSARAAFTGGDGIDIVAGDIRVDNTVSRVGHIHDDRYYTETEVDTKLETRVKRHRFPINDDGTYNVVPSYSNSTRRITLTPTGASFDVWINGTKHTFTGAQTLPQHSAASGVYFYYLDENGVFQASTAFFELLKVAPVAVVIWNSAKGEGRWIHELHTTRMSARTHALLHSSKGTVPEKNNGFAMSGYTLNTDTPSAVSFGVAGGILWDEDIEHQIPSLADGGPYEIWYRTGASGAWTWDSVSTLPYKYGATYFTVNQIVTGAWAQVEINTGGVATWGNLFVLATPNNGGVPIICVQGQNIYTDAASAKAESWDAMDKGSIPFPEYFALYRVTYKASVAYTGVTGRVRIEAVTTVSSGGESGLSGATVHNSLGGRDAIDAHPALSITDIYNLTNGVMLKKISTGIVAATAADLPAHASRHQVGGSDPLAGQQIPGLLVTSTPTFAALQIQPASTVGDIGFLNSSGSLRMIARWDDTNDRLAWVTRNDDGSARTTRFHIPRSSSLDVTVTGGFSVTGQTTLQTSLSGMLKAVAGVVGVASASDLPNHASRHHSGGADALVGQSIAGLLVTSGPTFASMNLKPTGTTGDLAFLDPSGTLRHILRWDNANDRIAFVTRNDDGSARATRLQIPRSSSLPVSIFNGLTISGTTTIDTSLTGMLKATAGVVSIAGASDIPAHAAAHQWDGADPIQGQQLLGLRAFETPVFGGIRGGSVIGYLPFFENNGTEIMRLSSTGMLVQKNVSLDGDLRIANLSGALAAQNGTVRLATGSDLPSHIHSVLDIGDSGAVGRDLMYAAIPAGARSILELTGWATKTFTNGSTTDVAEGTNLYFTNARAQAAISGLAPISVSSGVVSHSATDGYKHVPANGTSNSGKFLVAGAIAGDYTWETIAAASLPNHASRHHSGGADPLAGQSIAGLLTTSTPTFAGLSLKVTSTLADLNYQSLAGTRQMVARWDAANDNWDLFSCDDAGSPRLARIRVPRSSSIAVQIFNGLTVTGTTTLSTSLMGVLKATNGVVGVAGASDLPSHSSRHHWDGDDALVGQSIAGLRTSSSPEFAGLKISSLSGILKASSGIVSIASGSDLPAHAANHHWNGSDPIQGQSLAGLLTSSSPSFAALTVGTLTGMLKATAGVLAIADANDLPNHASRHHFGGADPLTGQSISGLLVTSTPTFKGMSLQGATVDDAYLRFYDNSGSLKHQLRRYSNANGGGLLLLGPTLTDYRINVPSLGTLPIEIDGGLKIFTGDLTVNTTFNGLLKSTAGVVSVVGAAGIDPGLVNVPYGRIPFGGSSGLTYSDKLRFNDPYADILWVDSDVDIRGTVYANDLQLPLDGSIVSFSAAMIQFGDGVAVPRVLFPNVATNKAFQVDGLATFAHISAYLLEGDVQADRDEIESDGTRTLPEATAAMVGKERRFCAGGTLSTYTVQVATPASEVLIYRSRTTGLRVVATSLDIVDSATTFVCHAVGRWTAIGY